MFIMTGVNILFREFFSIHASLSLIFSKMWIDLLLM
jgi:hypothetical protein